MAENAREREAWSLARGRQEAQISFAFSREFSIISLLVLLLLTYRHNVKIDCVDFGFLDPKDT